MNLINLNTLELLKLQLKTIEGSINALKSKADFNKDDLIIFGANMVSLKDYVNNLETKEN